MALPDFVVVGAPDAGTRVLHAALARHPGLAMSEPAEPGFFLAPGERPPHPGGAEPDVPVWCRADYEALFPNSGLRPRGESTPYYLADFPAQRRMHELLPYLRMVVVLRDPVERAYANWLAQRSAGLEQLPTLAAALEAEEARRAAGWKRRWRYAEHGRYGSQLRRLHTLFPPGQVLLVRYRDLVARPAAALRDICAFVRAVDPASTGAGLAAPGCTFVPAVLGPDGVRAREVSSEDADPLAPALAVLHRRLDPGPPLPPGLREQVLDRFADDIMLLAEVTRQSYDEWLDRGDLPLGTSS
ncbi:sulfotransferase [Parafrankia colletiae]|uniref:Sulfotransferase n=1 Tax=Parafrankia colletiae TaxID=573497 RepID=A0A1S1Q8R5_9ACTN|nr:sulfotransferase [Parafrankia colletiae]MCK9903372.1 sulfotransferase [Frankia sp. Cpl3]OHV29997.1 sulfotransferase [Parafrankia colletiae]